MLNIKELTKAVKQVAEEKGLEPEKIMEVIESSIAAAYKREYGERGEVVKCKLDEKTGSLQFWQVKTVVDETTVRFVEEGEEEAEAAKKLEAGSWKLEAGSWRLEGGGWKAAAGRRGAGRCPEGPVSGGRRTAARGLKARAPMPG